MEVEVEVGVEVDCRDSEKEKHGFAGGPETSVAGRTGSSRHRCYDTTPNGQIMPREAALVVSVLWRRDSNPSGLSLNQ